MTEETVGINKPRQKLLAMAAIAFVPIFTAYVVFFFFPQWMPGVTVNEGTFIDPPQQVEAAYIDEGKWSVLMLLPPDCASACRENVFEARQIHISLGKNMDRVNRYLISARPLSDEFKDYLEEAEIGARVLMTPELERRLRGVAGEQSGLVVLLADPNLNLVLYYEVDKIGKPLLKDLKHLLKVSNIG